MSNLSPRLGIRRPQWLAALFALLLAPVACDRYRKTSSDWGNAAPRQTNAADSLATTATHLDDPADDGDHWHRTGAMGGFVTSLAADRYHAELVIEASGRRLSIYFMRDDETQLTSVPAQFLTGYYKPLDRSTSQAIMFLPEPLDGDESGKTSRLVGSLDVKSQTGETRAIDVQSEAYLAIPGLVLEAGDRRSYMLRFRIASPSDRVSEQQFALEKHRGDLPRSVTESLVQPNASAAEDRRELYTTPGGKYTEADIAANGKRTAADAYPAFRPQHDPSPQAGDTICPITRTKANRNCTWIVDGQEYSFCCPPCIDEFLAMAKERPDEILSADEYRQ